LRSILIIDDSKFLCAVLRDTLEKTGYKATTVNSIIEAAKFLKVETPDLILLDINLPGGVQGNDACRMLKGSPSCRNVPIVLMSSATAEEMAAVLAHHLDQLLPDDQGQFLELRDGEALQFLRMGQVLQEILHRDGGH
jgi:CheY-like chemotaxis protein